MSFLLVAPAEGGVKVTATPSSLRQRDAGALIVTGVPEAKLIEGSVGDRPLIFFPYADGYVALIGVDLAAPTGSATWRVGWVDGAGNPRKAGGTIKIKSRKFPVQKLSLPGNLVDLDRVTEQRADRGAGLADRPRGADHAPEQGVRDERLPQADDIDVAEGRESGAQAPERQGQPGVAIEREEEHRQAGEGVCAERDRPVGEALAQRHR